MMHVAKMKNLNIFQHDAYQLICNNKTKMNPEVKQNWLTALRSNDYKQLPHNLMLRESKNACCLGVLCDIQNINKDFVNYGDDELGDDDANFVHFWYKDSKLKQTEELPEDFRQEMNIDEDIMTALATLNDSFQFSFSEIADLIEKHL